MAILLPELLVTDPAALRAWLEEHHATSPGVRLVLTKKGGLGHHDHVGEVRRAHERQPVRADPPRREYEAR